MTRSRIAALFIALAFLAACGQKGALYFAEEKASKPEPATAQTSSDEQALSAEKEPSDDSQ
jgi:predicted small lipoprotein YifL